MGFDVNGQWTSDFYPIQDRDAGIAILASKFQTLIQTDIKNGFNNCITRDGSGKPTANLNLNGHKIINLTSGVNANDAVNKSQMESAISDAQSSAIASSLRLLEFKWFDHILDEQSWLRADTFSWQSGATYSNAYNHLVDDIDGISSSTETIAGTTITYYQATDGHKIVLADQETNVSAIYNATGVAWYYILDTTNTRFKLPRTKYAFVGLRDTVGKYVAESLPDHNHEISLYDYADSGHTSYLYKENGNYQYTFQTTNASASNSTYQDGAPVQQRATQMYLYFYVGQFTQTATEQTAGLNAELFNGKLDRDFSNKPANIHYVVETYSNGTDWYRVWSDGWCEQGGLCSSSTTYNFLKPYINANYNITGGLVGTNNTSTYEHMNFYNLTVNGFDYKTTDSYNCYWRACGYIS